MNYKYEVSVVIVCMNNITQLCGCLNSIFNNTHKVNYEVLLVAYFFSKENLEFLEQNYPWVKIIISDEIRGFSANNNLALRNATGKYCFVLNDDTYFFTPVIDELYETIESVPDASLVSPKILTPQGLTQYSGIPPISWIDWLLILYKLKREKMDKTGKYIREEGLFKTYNILGAAFIINTSFFRNLGFFYERYFYGPEDKALSTTMNKSGFYCYVNADIILYHIGGATGGSNTKTVCATRPAERKGSVIMMSEGKLYRKIIMSSLVWLNSFLWSFGWMIKFLFGNKTAKYSLIANINVCQTIFSKEDTTSIFKRFYEFKKK